MAVSVERRPLATTVPERSASQMIGIAIRYTLLTALAVLVFMPFILSFLGTFKTDREVTAYPPTFLPQEWHFENWAATWGVQPLCRMSDTASWRSAWDCAMRSAYGSG